ncbi:ABC transporter permease, partial [Escherichia coli]
VSVKGAKTVVAAFVGIILLAIGYASMVYMDKLAQIGIIIALITVTSGTYMLFGTFLPLIIKKLKSNKKRTEKGLNAFTFAQLNFRINSLTKVLATVAMLVALGAGAISGGMAFKNNVMLTVDGFAIYDVGIHNPTAEEKKILDGITFKEKNEYRYKTDDKFV